MNPTQLISRLESLPPEEKTPELTKLESELRDHAKYFNELMTRISTTGILTEEIKREKEERSKIVREVGKKILAILEPNPILELLAVKSAFETQVSRYRSLGWLVKQDEKEGIIGLDQNFYPIPSIDAIQEALSEQAELFTYKHSQGFKKFMLVPFGMSYVEMYNKLETEYKRYAEDNDLKLYRTDVHQKEVTKIKDVPCLSDDMEKESELVYYPETLYRDDPEVHQAKSKADLITSSRFPGWELHLIPENPLLARKQKDKDPEIIGDRPVFEGNEYFGDYLDRMKGREGTMDKKVQPVKDADGQNVYRGEVGLIPELWAAWALEELYINNHVLHDWDSELEMAAVLMGTLTSKNKVAVSYFSQGNHRVELYDYTTGTQGDFCAGASSVKVC